MNRPSPPDGRRLLICGPVFPSIGIGGLPLALEALGAALAVRGWTVDLAITPDALGFGPETRRATVLPRWDGRRWAWAPRLRYLPADGRLLLQHTLLGGGVARTQSDAMHAIDARLARVHYDAVIAHLYQASPGFGRFILSRHPRVLLSSLDGLASELRLAPWLWLPRLIARLAPGRLHRDLYRAVDPRTVSMAVFGSDAWRDDARRAGLPAEVARVIPFGVPPPAPLPDPRPVDGRLLWVGRLSPEKGLHVFLEAIARLRRTRRVGLTAICGEGPERYRHRIERRIVRLGLTDAVTLMPAVPRSALPRLYASHDALLFHSVFREPAALVVMEAFSAGLPVVAPAGDGAGGLIEADQTCVSFETRRPRDVAAAIARVLDDPDLRDRVRARAHATIAERFTIDAMGLAYDAALRALMPSRAEHGVEVREPRAAMTEPA